jgi:hypothetical protein
MAEQTASKKPEAKKPAAASNGSAEQGRPNRPLPTDRIGFQRQLDILRAFAIASGENKNPVRNADVAAVSDFAASTLSQANAFLVDSGMLVRTTDGFIPDDAVLAFAHAYKWQPETAAHKLASILSETWFAEALLPRLQFRDISETEAFTTLSEEVGADPRYREQIAMLLMYLEAANLLRREGNMIALCKAHHEAHNAPKTPRQPAADRPAARPDPSPPPAPAQPESRQPRNAFDFSVSFNVSMDELHEWSADRIAAFFNGVATVINAKKGTVEKSTE